MDISVKVNFKTIPYLTTQKLKVISSLFELDINPSLNATLSTRSALEELENTIREALKKKTFSTFF